MHLSREKKLKKAQALQELARSIGAELLRRGLVSVWESRNIQITVCRKRKARSKERLIDMGEGK